MKFIEWGAGSIGDDGLDGSVEVRITGVKFFGFLPVPNVDQKIPVGRFVEMVGGLVPFFGDKFGAAVELVKRLTGK